MGFFSDRKHGNREDYKAQLGSAHRREARIKEKMSTMKALDVEYLKKKRQLYREIADIQAGRA